jgi:membrane-associated phospholipid phosphatase
MDGLHLFRHLDVVLLFGACLTGLAFLSLLKWCVPDENPLGLVWQILREHAVSMKSLFYLLTLLSIMFLDILETKYDDVITSHLSWDFTSLFLHIEGAATGLFQIVHSIWLTYALSVVYLYIFPVMGLVCVIAVYHGGERMLARKLFWTTVFNYVLILPFYILVPVSERWAVLDGQVTLLMNHISPLLIEGLRPLSGLNNCFPSFHTSLALSFAILISQSGNRRLRQTMYVLAGLVVYSTLYLGFHWVLDAFAGVIFAATCSLLATYAVENFKLELVFSRTR